MLSLIVPARNNAPTTAACVRSALNSLDRLKLACELVLIDDAGGGADPNILPLFKQLRAEAAPHEVIIAQTRTRFHYSGVFALGPHLARRENVFFLSNDMIITPAFFL
ncbi:MAG: glycosyltransferase family 2 protein, partial [Stellaceae bacterium]